MIIKSDTFVEKPIIVCSIIVYNQKEWIGRCIDGMLNQKFVLPYVIVIADDCSTDGTREVLLDYQQRYPEIIKLVLNENNGGIAANWVSCCKECVGGKYIAFCDGDDYWSNPDKLKIQYEYMEAHQECVVLTTDCDTEDADGHVLKSVNRGRTSKQGHVQRALWDEGGVICPSSNMFFRKETFDKHVPLDAFIEYDFPFQDWPALVIMAGYGECHYLPVSTSTYRIGHESDSHAQSVAKLERRMRRIQGMNAYLNSLFPNLPFAEDEYKRSIPEYLVPLCIKNGDYSSARKYSLESGKKTFRNLCCRNWLTFQMFRTGKLLNGRFGRLLQHIRMR